MAEQDPYARARARSEARRAELKPLGPGERPLGLKLAIGLAAFIALANLVGVAFGAGSEKPALGLAFAAVMIAAAAGMWARRYLVMIAFQALLAVAMIYALLSLAVASNALGALLAAAVVVVCAPIFWLMVRVMARLQVPPGPPE